MEADLEEAERTLDLSRSQPEEVLNLNLTEKNVDYSRNEKELGLETLVHSTDLNLTTRMNWTELQAVNVCAV